ncbi:ATP-binding protein [Rhizobium ruizarguesonis]|uniref:ATP-binding protein n=1 Tax=Rhizobium ruizarguesonis TaxID=2081791 RepID=UPI0013DF7BC4|nr:ATP-binding protein [Rhizobium ruizarguesonis]NEI82130.1 hypothetical protein [Rhizobium ruizarguesonis]
MNLLYQNTGIAAAIQKNHLPATLVELFGDLFDEDNGRILLQETTIIDFKETIPSDFSGDYGAGIIRLALSFHNTFGGLIVFGVVDRTGVPSLAKEIFNIEAFNRVLSDISGNQIECSLRRYALKEGADALPIQVVLVPARRAQRPARLKRPLFKYAQGALWVRDRHEVLTAEPRHLPLLYGDRSSFFSRNEVGSVSVHRSLPPSPSTMDEFVGRFGLLHDLWDWLVFSNHVRMYLHGPGGSGKSTLAYEFATAVAHSPYRITLPKGNMLDYVLFLSAKETALDPFQQKENNFTQRDFATAEEKVRQILYHAGLAASTELDELSEESVEEHLDELVEHFTGLIVIDDIDALTRRNRDTGEELLFQKAAQSSGRLKILYTSRYAPPYALKTAKEVPSLDFEHEFFPFMESCCRQFEVAPPASNNAIRLFEISAGLPILIETIIGLRRNCSSYEEAFKAYESREGDAARRYLYQREYDRLEAATKARHMLAALSLIETPVSITAIGHITSYSEEQIRDAVTQTKGIFLKSTENENGDTLYELATPAIGFVRQVSPDLPYYPALQKAISHFKQESGRTPAHEAAILVRMQKLARTSDFERIVEEGAAIPTGDSIWGNPQFLGLLGQGYAARGAANAEDARGYFARAFALHSRDIFMLRAWYKLEFSAQHTIKSAEDLCRKVLQSGSLSQRHRSEFYSKLGQVLETQARPFIHTDKTRAISMMKASLDAYFEGKWLAREVEQLDSTLQNDWITNLAGKLFRLLQDDLEPLFDFIEKMSDKNHDVDLEAIRILIDPMKSMAHNAKPWACSKVAGLARRTAARYARLKKPLSEQPGFSYVIEALRDIIQTLHSKMKTDQGEHTR